MFHRFPKTEPLPLAAGETSPLFALPILVGQEEAFIRVVALWVDNRALADAAPTFQIKAPEGIITSVEPDAADVEIPGEAGAVVATANCRLLPDAVHLITISDISPDATSSNILWKLRIRNNADQTLRFVCVASHKEENTRQPWMAVGDLPDDGSGPAELRMVGQGPVRFVAVRNWGTEPLRIQDEPGMPIGGEQSPVTLVSRPSVLPPHGVDHIVLRSAPVDADVSLSHLFVSNDLEPNLSTLNIRVSRFSP